MGASRKASLLAVVILILLNAMSLQDQEILANFCSNEKLNFYMDSILVMREGIIRKHMISSWLCVLLITWAQGNRLKANSIMPLDAVCPLDSKLIPHARS